MGFLWDLVQQSQISAQHQQHASLEGRIQALETELQRTQALLRALIERLETNLRTDLNNDGRIG
jgi:uncharacterized coiled-coil protein SlyX